LRAIVDNLRAAGVEIEELEDGFRIQGSQRIRGGSPWRTYGDHRLAMTALIANCIFEQPVQIEETDSIRISYPGFAEHLRFLVSE
jgi:3-phosphoshikimate 1-carboxyvinyltransferase